jgi:hypothetical protein
VKLATQKVVAVLVLALSMALVTVPLAAAPADAAPRHTVAVCDTAKGRVHWNGKSPHKCPGRYILYDMTMWRNPKALIVMGRAPLYTWKSLVRDVNSANRWCNRNSLTCQLITGVGLMIIAPIVTSARG